VLLLLLLLACLLLLLPAAGAGSKEVSQHGIQDAVREQRRHGCFAPGFPPLST